MEARDCDLNRVNPTLLNLITILTDLCCSAECLLKSCLIASSYCQCIQVTWKICSHKVQYNTTC